MMISTVFPEKSIAWPADGVNAMVKLNTIAGTNALNILGSVLHELSMISLPCMPPET
jgi:hypothetical protein